MLDFYTGRSWSLGFKHEVPIAHDRNWFEWTLSLGPFRVSRLSVDAQSILSEQE